jgi:tRNA (cytidine/uridine-2'-O-)-methyltransferase
MPRLALYQPDIPQNTGTILRMAACLAVDVIQPTGFDMTDRALRRAGLDYLEHVAITRHASFAAFEAWRHGEGRRLVLLTSAATTRHHDFAYRDSDILMLGRESAGAPEVVHRAADARIRIPMRAGLRSLNIAVAAALVLGEALRMTGGWPEGLATATEGDTP